MAKKHPNMIDVTGQTFGMLTAIEHVDKRTGSGVIWRCRCQCGSDTFAKCSDLRSGKTRSCGCLRRITSARTGVTHGDTRRGRWAKEYRSWRFMLTRCEDPTHRAYPYYGGRGIRVCERWKDYASFLADMGRKPEGRYSLDRIDNDGDYEPGNVRWATQAQQTRNYSRNVMLTYQGLTLCMTDWARRLGFKTPTGISHRLQVGWSIERTLTTPARGSHAATVSRIDPDSTEP